MKSICETTQETLSQLPGADLEIAHEHLSHLGECAECAAVRNALLLVDEELGDMLMTWPPDELFEAALAAATSQASVESGASEPVTPEAPAAPAEMADVSAASPPAESAGAEPAVEVLAEPIDAELAVEVPSEPIAAEPAVVVATEPTAREPAATEPGETSPSAEPVRTERQAPTSPPASPPAAPNNVVRPSFWSGVLDRLADQPRLVAAAAAVLVCAVGVAAALQFLAMGPMAPEWSSVGGDSAQSARDDSRPEEPEEILSDNETESPRFVPARQGRWDDESDDDGRSGEEEGESENRRADRGRYEEQARQGSLGSIGGSFGDPYSPPALRSPEPSAAMPPSGAASPTQGLSRLSDRSRSSEADRGEQVGGPAGWRTTYRTSTVETPDTTVRGGDGDLIIEGRVLRPVVDEIVSTELGRDLGGEVRGGAGLYDLRSPESDLELSLSSRRAANDTAYEDGDDEGDSAFHYQNDAEPEEVREDSNGGYGRVYMDPLANAEAGQSEVDQERRRRAREQRLARRRSRASSSTTGDERSALAITDGPTNAAQSGADRRIIIQDEEQVEPEEEMAPVFWQQERPTAGPATSTFDNLRQQVDGSTDRNGLDDLVGGTDDGQYSTFLPPEDVVRGLANRFLAGRDRIEGLRFQDPTGYWANTYVPGDPVLRALQQRLRAQQLDGDTISALAEEVSPVAQPFDSPERASLGVYVHSDRRAIEGESRVLLQVGLQGTSRRGGRRSVMNVGVVVDMREQVDTQSAAAIRSLLEALSRSREVGDRFSIVAAGRPGPYRVSPREFTYGQASVIADELLVEQPPAGHATSLTAAMAEAVSLMQAAEEESDTLGSNLLLVVTPHLLGAELHPVESLAHRAAVGGVTTSVVGVGRSIDLAELDRIALAGQGNRRILREAGEAQALVGRELAASGDVVARAVRLRIRLAPGVQLVDVLGSHRLDNTAADRVRAAEQSVDQRLSQQLGILSDRGEDEDGIQIVIPAFYADDSHVILLDVVAPGPGTVAEVQVRYKDLVHLRNGVAMDTLRLDRGSDARGPLELNVLKNLLAYELSELLAQASVACRHENWGLATEILADAEGLLRGVHLAVPELSSDRELRNDLVALGRYLGEVGDAPYAPQGVFADSLLYAGYRKLIEPRPTDSGQ